MEDSPKNNINIQLGDILIFAAPENILYDNKQFYVKYLDRTKITLINIENNEILTLQLIDGELENKTIISMELLSRSDTAGYARQNNLLPGTWVNIYFDVEIPFILTGEITNLEEDMIEIKTYPKNETIYIDFEYKGIPETLPIEKIVIRDSLNKQTDKLIDGLSSQEYVDTIPNRDDKSLTDDEEIEIVPFDLNEIILEADQFIMGEKLDDIIQYIDVDESEMRYSIDKQTNDLLDELLADIPNYKRTPIVLNEIHKLIERFIQLRNMFSNFDTNGNAIKQDILNESIKPIIQNILNLDTNFSWMIPVSQNKKKLYNIDESISNLSEINDFDAINQGESLESEIAIIERYKSSNNLEENKYLLLFKSLNDYLTPFENIQYDDRTITTQQVNTNILSMTNNLGELYSSVADNTKGDISRKQYYFDIYNKNITYLKNNKPSNISPNDTINIISFIILPLQVLLYSRINLPKTNILKQSELDNVDFAYWKLFKKNKNIRTIVIDNLSIDTNYIKEFIQGINSNVITEYVLSEDLWNNPDKYNQYLNNIIPTNSDILNLLKNTLKNNYSIHSVINFLEIFKIEKNDITYDLYSEIDNFIDENIHNYKQSYLSNYKHINKLTRQQKPKPYVANLFKIFEINESVDINKSLKSIILDTYGFNPDIIYSDSEILNIILRVDSGKLFTIAIIKMNLDLQSSNLVNSFVKKYKEIILDKQNIKNNCKTICKKYNSIHALINDSQKVIYYDEIYDKTNYKLLKEYKNKLSKLSPEEFKQYLIEKLIEKNDMNNNDALREANAIILGKRLIENGDYAILVDDTDISIEPESNKSSSSDVSSTPSSSDVSSSPSSSDVSSTPSSSDVSSSPSSSDVSSSPSSSEEKSSRPSIGGGQDSDIDIDIAPIYYIRQNDKWVKEDSTTTEFGKLGSTNVDNNLLCNLQEKCIIDNNDTCVSFENAENKIIENTLESIHKEFDETYGEKEDNMRKRIDNILLENILRIKYLKKYDQAQNIRYDILKINLANSINKDLDEIIVESPYEKLKDLILGQSDELKKQYDIQRFVVHFTRSPYETEDQHWLYCRKTNVKLLPQFISHLASIYILNKDYQLELDIICANQGTISDDGEAWIDKYSGYFIKKIDFDTEEGYTEEGFKLKTREILEIDAGDKILQKKKTKEQNLPITPESQQILNIIVAMTTNMGINLDTEKEFIIKNVISIHKISIDKKEVYNKKIKEALSKGRKNIPTYEEYINTSYIILTLIFILVAIQVSIPSIKTRKTFPGCIRSFVGYPLNNDDKSAITYMACIANKIKSSTQPWNSILKLNPEKIILQMEGKIKKFILNNKNILKRFEEKQKYSQTEKQDIILLEYDTEKLLTFYPPLLNFKITGLTNISDIFKDNLKKNIKSGSYNQQKEILTLKSKLIFYGLSIQEKIQKIINKKIPLITNNIQEPYLENACCDTLSSNVHQYFIDIDKTLVQDNNISIDLDNMLYDINSLGKAPIYYDPLDTKQKYPEISTHFSQDTIYRAFVVFCNDKSLILNEDLRTSCQLNSEIKYKQTINEQIQQLKENGVNYSEELFQKLLTIVNLTNLVHINLNIIPQNSIHILTDILETIELTEKDTIIPTEFIKHFKNILDSFSIKSTTDDVSVRNYRNYLAILNTSLLEKIEKFTKNNANLSKTNFKHFIEWITNITTFIKSGDDIYIDSDDETVFKMMNFIKNSINYLVDIFPNIILNNIDKSNVTIPKHWKLSQKHTTDIKTLVNKYYYKLHKFYDDEDFITILTNIQLKCKNIQLLAEHTPFFASFNNGKKEINSIFDNRLLHLLYKFYFLSVIDTYIELLSSEHYTNPDSISSASIADSLLDEESEEIAETDNIMKSKEREAIEIESIKKSSKSVEDKIIDDDEVEVDEVDELDDEVDVSRKQTISSVSPQLDNDQNDNDILSSDEESDSNTQIGGGITRQKYILSPQKLSNLLFTFIEILAGNEKDSNKNIINFNYENIMEKILRSKEKEKDLITDHLKELTDEERKVENILKNQKLDKWGKGLTKGLTQYVADNYDDERDALEQQAIKEKKLGINSAVTDMNKDIYEFDMINEDAIAEEIENEEYNLDGLPEDDDYGDNDGDE